MSARPLEQHYTAEEVAAAYRLKEDTVYRAMQRKPGEKGYLRSVMVNRGARRIPESALSEWLRSDGPEPILADVHDLDERRQSGKH